MAMKSMYDVFRNDTAAEQEGIYVDYGSFRVRLARAGGANKAFQRSLEAKTRSYRRAIQTDSLDNETANRILMEVYAETVVRGWELLQEDGSYVSGIENPEGGEPLPFNSANVFITFKALPDLFTDIREQAANATLYRAALREAATGN